MRLMSFVMIVPIFLFFHQRHHALPIRSLKVRACVTVIYKELRIAEAVFLCISAEIGFLIHNAVTVAL